MIDIKKEVLSTLYETIVYLRGIHQRGRTSKNKAKLQASYRIVYPLLPLGLWEYNETFGGDLFVYLKTYMDQQIKLNKLSLCLCTDCQVNIFKDMLVLSAKPSFYSLCYKHIKHNEVN